MEEGRSAYKMLIGKPTGRRPLGGPRRIWEDNNRMDIKETGIFFSVLGDSACSNQGRPGNLQPEGILFLDILTNLSTSILVTCWSHSLLLLSSYSLIGWILQDYLICWLLILSIFVLPTIFLGINTRNWVDSA